MGHLYWNENPLKELFRPNFCCRPMPEYPESLIKIIFNPNHNKIIDDFPKHLKYLTLGYSFNCIINNFPHSLKTIRNKNKFNFRIPSHIEITHSIRKIDFYN